MIANIANLQQEAYQYLIEGDYSKATSLYEKLIAVETNNKSYYWHLGLLLLLQGKEAEAQMTWMFPLAEVETGEIECYTNELIQVLETEAERRETLAQYDIVWLIRQHTREINPEDIDNIFKIILLSIHLGKFDVTELSEYGILEKLQKNENLHLEQDLLWQTLEAILKTIPFHPITLEFIEGCLQNFSNPQDCFPTILTAVIKIGHSLKQQKIASQILEIYLQFDTNNLEALRHLAIFYQDNANYSQGIETAKLCYSLSETLPDKIFAIHLVLRGLMGAGGYWQEVCSACQQLELILLEFIQAQPLSTDEV